ncbi:hypothetical protein KCP78_18105 [Salmonella enterica subsp. enterica]|nr:hypothetical protein KCP78_18105 [Salmonella enterica subsp. enterica]
MVRTTNVKSRFVTGGCRGLLILIAIFGAAGTSGDLSAVRWCGTAVIVFCIISHRYDMIARISLHTPVKPMRWRWGWP